MMGHNEDIVYRSIEEASILFEANSKSLLAMPDMRRLLNLYNIAAENTQATMRHAGVADTCGFCAEKTGSCCFQEVETWYDPMLLLINLLLHADLPRSRQIPGQCLFLGTEGCRLRARYCFCLNYFCPALKIQLSSEMMNLTLAAVGQELAAGWELEQAIYRYLRDKN